MSRIFSISERVAIRLVSSRVWTRSMEWPTSRAQLVAAGSFFSACTYSLKVRKRNQPPSSSSRSIGTGTGGRIPFGAGASEMPQFPATTVVTPWLTFGAISGDESIRRSSCVCASMKPGAAILPAASISFLPFSLTFPMRAIFPARTAISAWKRGLRVPSITTALRMTRSSGSVNLGPRAADDLGPLGRLALHQRQELLRRAAVGLGVELPVAFHDVGSREGRLDLLPQSGSHFGRQLRRPDHAAPGHGLVARHAGLGDRRQVGEHRRAPRARHRDAAHTAALRVRADRGEVVEHELHVARDEVG